MEKSYQRMHKTKLFLKTIRKLAPQHKCGYVNSIACALLCTACITY